MSIPSKFAHRVGGNMADSGACNGENHNAKTVQIAIDTIVVETIKLTHPHNDAASQRLEANRIIALLKQRLQ